MKRIIFITLSLLLSASMLLASGCKKRGGSNDPGESSFSESDAPLPTSRREQDAIPEELPDGEWVKTVYIQTSILSADEELYFNQVSKQIDLSTELADDPFMPDEDESETPPPTEAMDEKYSSIFQPVTVIAKNPQSGYVDYAYLVAVFRSDETTDYWAILTLRKTGKNDISFLDIVKIEPDDLHTDRVPPNDADPDCFLPTEELTQSVMLHPQAQAAFLAANESYTKSYLDPLSLIAVRSDSDSDAMQYLLISRAITRTLNATTAIEFVTVTVESDGSASISDESYLSLDYYTNREAHLPE